MRDVNCPYCDAEVEINHDDGYGYGEDEVFEQECGECEKHFVYTTSISFSYDAKQADCLNDGEHSWKPTATHPREFTKMRCTVCDNTRSCTPEELRQVMEKSNGS